MALISCRNCGHMVSDRAAQCPRCGAPVMNGMHDDGQGQPVFNDEHPNKSHIGLWAMVILLVIALGTAVFFLVNNSKSSNAEAPADSTRVAKVNGAYSLIGTVDNYGAWMYLDIDAPAVVGVYHYDFNAVRAVLRLRGKIDDEGNIVMTEKTSGGTLSGRFEGKFDGETFAGTFYNLTKGTDIPFAFTVDSDKKAAKTMREWGISVDGNDEEVYEEDFSEPLEGYEDEADMEDFSVEEAPAEEGSVSFYDMPDGAYVYEGLWNVGAAQGEEEQQCQILFTKSGNKLYHCSYINLRWSATIPLQGSIRGETLHFAGKIQGKDFVIHLYAPYDTDHLEGTGIDYKHSGFARRMRLERR